VSEDSGCCVALAHEGRVFSKGFSIMLDDGANACLITEKTCMHLDIPYGPPDVKLHTSNGVGTPVVGVTPPLMVESHPARWLCMGLAAQIP
jgi:hypothetical protein